MSGLTEEEAKDKWCPFSRVLSSDIVNGKAEIGPGDPSGFNRVRHGAGPVVGSLCIGSACMAWREVSPPGEIPKELWSKSMGKAVSVAFGDDAEWRPIEGGVPPSATGFCGLAGRPS